MQVCSGYSVWLAVWWSTDWGWPRRLRWWCFDRLLEYWDCNGISVWCRKWVRSIANTVVLERHQDNKIFGSKCACTLPGTATTKFYEILWLSTAKKSSCCETCPSGLLPACSDELSCWPVGRISKFTNLLTFIKPPKCCMLYLGAIRFIACRQVNLLWWTIVSSCFDGIK